MRAVVDHCQSGRTEGGGKRGGKDDGIRLRLGFESGAKRLAKLGIGEQIAQVIPIVVDAAVNTSLVNVDITGGSGPVSD